jgi:hypothetical protein
MFKNLFKQRITVTFYMKSGNVLVFDRVRQGFNVTSRGDEVVKIEGWEQKNARNKLMLVSLNLSQIEAISVS